MLRTIILLTLGLQAAHGQDLTGQVFHMAEYYSEEKCTAFAQGDCDTSDLFFLTDTQFCFITKCINNDSYFTGTYLIKDKKLVLTFKQIEVTVITDDSFTKTEPKRKNTKIEPHECIMTSCGLKARLLYSKITSGSRATLTEETKMTKELKRNSAWKLLQN